MTKERAVEIVKKVIDHKEILNEALNLKNSADLFYVGRMVRQMQNRLEIELSLEIEQQESEE